MAIGARQDMTQVGNQWRQSIHLANDRLTEDSTSGTDAHVYTYTFDSRDNILSSSETGSVVTRSYDAASRLVSSSDGSTYTFDANGNLTAIDDIKSEFEYDKENRLIFYSSESNPGVETTMVYNAFGQKKRETNPDMDMLFTWDGDDYYGFADAANDPENAVKIFISDGGTMLGEFDPADSQSRMDYMVDFLGSVTGSTDKNGGLLGSDRRYKPFGELLSGDPVKPLNFAWTGNTGSMYTGLLYTEQYNRARHYSTTTNIWTTRDLLWPSEHPYGYVGGNSVTLLDPTGKIWQLATCTTCAACFLDLAIVCSDCGSDIECWAECALSTIENLPPWTQVLCGGSCVACLIALISKLKSTKKPPEATPKAPEPGGGGPSPAPRSPTNEPCRRPVAPSRPRTSGNRPKVRRPSSPRTRKQDPRPPGRRYQNCRVYMLGCLAYYSTGEPFYGGWQFWQWSKMCEDCYGRCRTSGGLAQTLIPPCDFWVSKYGY